MANNKRTSDTILIASAALGACVVASSLLLRLFKRRKQIRLADADFSLGFSLAQEQVERLWSVHDTGSGGLDKPNVKRLVQDLCASMSRQEFLAEDYVINVFREDADDGNVDRAEKLIGKFFHDLDETSEQVFLELQPYLDMRKDGQIGKHEFVVLFGLWLERRVCECLRPVSSR